MDPELKGGGSYVHHSINPATNAYGFKLPSSRSQRGMKGNDREIAVGMSDNVDRFPAVTHATVEPRTACAFERMLMHTLLKSVALSDAHGMALPGLSMFPEFRLNMMLFLIYNKPKLTLRGVSLVCCIAHKPPVAPHRRLGVAGRKINENSWESSKTHQTQL